MDWTRLLAGVLILIGGFAEIVWGWRYWNRPDLLNPDSRTYKTLCIYLGTTLSRNGSERLSDGQIKGYAAVAIVLGIILVVIGILDSRIGVLSVF